MQKIRATLLVGYPIPPDVIDRSRTRELSFHTPHPCRVSAGVSHKATRPVTRRCSLISLVQREEPRTGITSSLPPSLSLSLSRFPAPCRWVRNLSNFRMEERSGAPREPKEEERLPCPRPRQLVKYACDRRGGAARERPRRGFSSDRLP
jgi:hypothetical protein